MKKSLVALSTIVLHYTALGIVTLHYTLLGTVGLPYTVLGIVALDQRSHIFKTMTVFSTNKSPRK